MQEESQDYMQGTVSAVIYQNEENGYTVLRLDVGDGALVTVVGCMPGVAPGESISVQGSWTRHASYGEQFKAETVERRLPAGAKAIFDYLSSGAVRGIGAATARRMIEEFGEDALTVLEEHPEQLTRIKGITRKKALTSGGSTSGSRWGCGGCWPFWGSMRCPSSWPCPCTAGTETGLWRSSGATPI